MEFKHTKGPWKVGRNEVYRPASTVSISPYYKQICSYVTSGPESIANANLIAAAPELLEDAVSDINAIDHFLHLLENDQIKTLKDLLQYLKEKKINIIAKATGGQI